MHNSEAALIARELACMWPVFVAKMTCSGSIWFTWTHKLTLFEFCLASGRLVSTPPPHLFKVPFSMMTALSHRHVDGKHSVLHSRCCNAMASVRMLLKPRLCLRWWDLGQTRGHSQVNEVSKKSTHVSHISSRYPALLSVTDVSFLTFFKKCVYNYISRP